jgi:RHO1 GDP-GTP exchange protein 1/2
MGYVKDLENMELVCARFNTRQVFPDVEHRQMFIRPLRNADPPIIPPDRLDSFIHDVFHNFAELHAHHRRLVDQFHDIQREEHPTIRSVTAVLFDATLNFREAYMEYIPNYPIAAYRVDDEMANNSAFKTFVEVPMLSFVCWIEFSTLVDSIACDIPTLTVMT